MDAVEMWLCERAFEFPPDSVEQKTLAEAATRWHSEGEKVLQWDGYGPRLDLATCEQMLREVIARRDPEHPRHGL